MFVSAQSHSHTQQRKASLQSPWIMQESMDVSGHGEGKKDNYLVEGHLKITAILPKDEKKDHSQVMCLRFSPDGSLIAVGQADGFIKIYNPDTGQCLHSLSDEQTVISRLPVTSLRFKPYDDSYKVEHKSILVATYASGYIKLWHYTSGQCIHTIHEDRQTLSAAFSPSPSNSYVTCGANPQLYLYDMKTNTKIRTLEASDSKDIMNGHKARVYTVQFHPRDSNVFLTGGWDDTVQFWDVRQKHSFRKIFGPHICGDALDIDPIHNHIVTGSWRREDVLQIWHFDSGEKIKTVPQDPMHCSMLYCAQWLGKENILSGGCNPNMARIIDRGTLNSVGQLVDLPAGVYCMDYDRQHKPKIAAGAENKIYIMKVEKQ